MLGDSVEKIALVKAGIMKPGCPVLVGPGCPMDILKVRHIASMLAQSPCFTLQWSFEAINKLYTLVLYTVMHHQRICNTCQC